MHVALRVAERLAADGIQAAVLDLRSLVPLDRAAVLALARSTHRVLIVHEDSRTGGIGESLAAIIQEEAFEHLDAPVRIIGALDTPVPLFASPRGVLPAERRADRESREASDPVLRAKEAAMGRIHWARVIGGGLLAGLVMSLLEIPFGLLMMDRFQAAH